MDVQTRVVESPMQSATGWGAVGLMSVTLCGAGVIAAPFTAGISLGVAFVLCGATSFIWVLAKA